MLNDLDFRQKKCSYKLVFLPLQCSTDGSYLSPQQIDIHPLIIKNHEKTRKLFMPCFSLHKEKTELKQRKMKNMKKCLFHFCLNRRVEGLLELPKNAILLLLFYGIQYIKSFSKSGCIF